MVNYLYLSLIPESLVVSMLPPDEFGAYLATGTRKRSNGQAMFFQVNRDSTVEGFDLSDADRRCVPHPDGQPKHSVYLGIYRVLERVPRNALGSLFLVTAHGQTLEIRPGEPTAKADDERYHLYQELAPVHPLTASVLGPADFSRFITETSRRIHVPRICFADLDLHGLARDPVAGDAVGLPYPNIDHIRHCLGELEPSGNKQTKMVDRVSRQGLIYRCVKTGFYVGDREGLTQYRYPSRDELESKYYAWWRCANDGELGHARFAI